LEIMGATVSSRCEVTSCYGVGHEGGGTGGYGVRSSVEDGPGELEDISDRKVVDDKENTLVEDDPFGAAVAGLRERHREDSSTIPMNPATLSARRRCPLSPEWPVGTPPVVR